jgi:hypothetical protein
LQRAARSVSAIEHAPHRLFAPGALVMLSALSVKHPHISRPVSSAPSASGSANASAASSSPPPSSSSIGVPIDQLALARVVLSPSMLRAHAASNYVAACENIAWHQ